MTAPKPAADRRPPTNAPREPRGCLPTFLVLAVMFAIPLSATASLGLAESAPLVPVRVSERVTIIPASGWEFGRLEDGAGVYITSGSGTLAAREVRGGSSPGSVLRETLDAWTSDPQIGIVVGEETLVDLGDQRPAVRVIYAGTFPEIASPIEGELTVVDVSGTLVMFDAWASEGQFRLVAEDIEAMIRSATPSP